VLRLTAAVVKIAMDAARRHYSGNIRSMASRAAQVRKSQAEFNQDIIASLARKDKEKMTTKQSVTATLREMAEEPAEEDDVDAELEEKPSVLGLPASSDDVFGGHEAAAMAELLSPGTSEEVVASQMPVLPSVSTVSTVSGSGPYSARALGWEGPARSAAEEAAASRAAVKAVSAPDGRTTSPALRFVRDAMVQSTGAATARARLENGSPSKALRTSNIRREMYRRQKKPSGLQNGGLRQADPIPMQDSRMSTSSAATDRSARGTKGGTHSVSPSLPPTSIGRPRTVPGTSGGKRIPQRPETSPQAGTSSLESFGSSGSSPRSRRQRSEDASDSPGSPNRTRSKSSETNGEKTEKVRIAPALKQTHKLYGLASRLSKKAFTVYHGKPEACQLARSCQKGKKEQQKLQRQEETNIAAAQSRSRNFQKDVLRNTGGAFRGLKNMRGKSMIVRPGTAESTRHGPSAKESDEEEPVSSGPVKELTVFEAFDLGNSFNLPPGQVTQAWKLFKRYDMDNDGLLAAYDFQLLLRAVLRERFPDAREVPRELFQEAIDIQSTGIAVTFPDFLTWITQNSFSEQVLLSDEQRFIRRIARKFRVRVLDIEAVKKHFDSFDTDGSGSIEYAEFYKLLGLLLNLTDIAALPESRVKSFWRELDDDHSGVVEFQEFIPWYIGYFGGYGASPLVNFYRKVRPVPFTEMDME